MQEFAHRTDDEGWHLARASSVVIWREEPLLALQNCDMEILQVGVEPEHDLSGAGNQLTI